MPKPSPPPTTCEVLPPPQICMLLAQLQEVANGACGALFCSNTAHDILAKDAANGYRFFLESFANMDPKVAAFVDRLSLKLFSTSKEFAELPRVTNATAWGGYISSGIRWLKEEQEYELVFYFGESGEMQIRIKKHIQDGLNVADKEDEGDLGKGHAQHLDCLSPALQNGNTILIKRFTHFIQLIRDNGDEEALFNDSDFSPLSTPTPPSGTVESITGHTFKDEGNLTRLFFHVRLKGKKEPVLMTPAQLSEYSELLEEYLDRELTERFYGRIRRYWKEGARKWVDMGRPMLTTQDKTAIGSIIEGIGMLITKRESNPVIDKLVNLYVNAPLGTTARVRSLNVRKGWVGGESKDTQKVQQTPAQEALLLKHRQKYIHSVKSHGITLKREEYGEVSLRGYRMNPQSTIRAMHSLATSLTTEHTYLPATDDALITSLSLPLPPHITIPTTPAAKRALADKAFKILDTFFNAEKGYYVQVLEGQMVEIEGVLLDVPTVGLSREYEVGSECCVWGEPRSLDRITGLIPHRTVVIRTLMGRDTPANPHQDQQSFLTFSDTLNLNHLTAHHSFNRLVDFLNDQIMIYRHIKQQQVSVFTGVSWGSEGGFADELSDLERLVPLDSLMKARRVIEEVRESAIVRPINHASHHFIPCNTSISYSGSNPLDRLALQEAYALFNGEKEETHSTSGYKSFGCTHYITPHTSLNLSTSLPQSFFTSTSQIHPIIITPISPDLSNHWIECLHEIRTLLSDALQLLFLDNKGALNPVTSLSGTVGVRTFLHIGLWDQLDSQIEGLGQSAWVKVGRSRPTDAQLENVIAGERRRLR